MKFFQIGFNKCGTVALHRFFLQNDIPSVHWDRGRLSRRMFDNHAAGRPLLEGYCDKYDAYSDMEHLNEGGGFSYAYAEFYKDLYHQYRDSIFILNYRNFDRWCSSRLRHGDYLFHCMRGACLTREEVIQQWRQHYHTHISEVREFFNGYAGFVEIDIESDPPDKLGKFLRNRGVRIDYPDVPKVHVTRHEPKEKDAVIDSLRDAALYFESYDVTTALQIMKVARKLRPRGEHINARIQMYKAYLAGRVEE